MKTFYVFGPWAWLVSIFFTIAVIVWLGWLILLGLVIALVITAFHALRRWWQRRKAPEPAFVRGRRYRVIWHDLEGPHNIPGTYVRVADERFGTTNAGKLMFARTVNEGGGVFFAPKTAKGEAIIERT